MNIRTLKASLPYLIRAKIPAMLVGHHGVGKTQGLSQFAKSTSAKLKILNLGTQEVGDIIGLADFIKDSSGQNVATKFMIPDWAKELYEFCVSNPDKIGILFLDEINRARRDVLQVVFPLLTEYRIHGLQFPTNFYVLGAMNPDTDDYNTTDITDKAFMSRFCHIKIESSHLDFLDYGHESGLDRVVLSFISTQPAMLRGPEKDFDLKAVQPDNRNWERVSVLQSFDDIPEKIRSELICGLVGLEASTAFLAHLNSAEKPVDGEEVVKNYKKVKNTILDQSDADNYRADLINETKEHVLRYLSELEGKVTDKQYANIIEFAVDLPNEVCMDFLQRLVKFRDIFIKMIDEKSLEKKLEQYEGMMTKKASTK